MGFLDSILKKKKGDSEAGDEAGAEGAESTSEENEEAIVAAPKPNPLAKLKGLVDHLEKIVLGLVLVGVTAMCVMEFLKAKKEVGEIKQADTDIVLGGEIMDLESQRPTNLTALIDKSTKAPAAISLKGTNHMVFNPRVWKEILVPNAVPPVQLIMDSPNTPLGISALKVSSITNFKAQLLARAFIGGGIVRHEFTWVDRQHPALPYELTRLSPQMLPLRTFFPQQPMGSSFLSSTASGWQPDPNKEPRPLHGFRGRAGLLYFRFNPEWEVKIKFKAVTVATQAQLAAAQANPTKTIPNVVYDLDVIKGVKNGLYPYETNSVRAVSNVPVEFPRGYEASFVYETKYHKKMELKKFREGRRLMIDGEIFRVFRITADTVSLVSDPAYGGNGKIFEKKLPQAFANPVAVPGPPAAVP
tara:strand:+ start:70 stop:1314 length:1245 start_codon:yes stop_codon:yes gene_type:complete